MVRILCFLAFAIGLRAGGINAEEKRPEPVITLRQASQETPAPDQAQAIAAKIVWGDHLGQSEAMWILKHRKEVATAIGKELEGEADRSALRRSALWLAVLEGRQLEIPPVEVEDLRIAANIGEIFYRTSGVESPYPAEMLSSIIRGKDEVRAHGAALNADVYKLRECLPALREAMAACRPSQVGNFSPTVARLDSSMRDVEMLLGRVDKSATTDEKASILWTLERWLSIERIAAEAAPAVESKILENPDLQSSGVVEVIWSRVASTRSLSALKEAAQSRKPSSADDPRPPDYLWEAIAKLTPRERLMEVFTSFPPEGAPLSLLRGAYASVLKEPMPELAPVIYRYATESADGIARLPVNSEVAAFLLEGCGGEGLEAADRLAQAAKDNHLARAVRWKKEGLTIASLANDLVEAGVFASGKAAAVESFGDLSARNRIVPSPEAYRVYTFLKERGVIAQVPLQDETMPVEYPAVATAFGSLEGGPLSVTETEQEVGGIEQLADVDPETLAVPETVKLRYLVRVHTAEAIIEFQPRDLRDRFDLESVAEAFNAAAAKLGLVKRFGVISHEDGQAIVGFGDVPALKKIFAKYHL